MRLFNTRIWIGIFFIALIIVLRFSGIGDYITLAELQARRLQLLEFVDAHYIWAVLAYIVWYIGIVMVALPLTALTTIAGGFLFGILPATIYANIGATIGGTLFFLFVRYALGTAIQERYKNKLQWVNRELAQYGVIYLIAIRFIAVIPFFVSNLLIGLTQTSVWTFIWTTSLGIIPGTVVYAFAGQQLTTITTIRDVFSLQVLLAFALLALLAIMPLIAKKMGWFGMNTKS